MVAFNQSLILTFPGYLALKLYLSLKFITPSFLLAQRLLAQLASGIVFGQNAPEVTTVKAEWGEGKPRRTQVRNQHPASRIEHRDTDSRKDRQGREGREEKLNMDTQDGQDF